jgi:hypothetical protein
MNQNKIAEVIHEAVLSSLETDSPLPKDITVYIPDDAMDILVSGLVSSQDSKPLPVGTKAVTLTVYDVKVTVRADSTDPYTYTPDEHYITH